MSLFHAIYGEGGVGPTPGPTPTDLQPVLLWSNSDTSSAFNGQTLSLDLSEYAGVLIDVQESTTITDLTTRVYIKKTDNAPFFGFGGQAHNLTVGRAYVREVSINDAGVTIGSCIKEGSTPHDVDTRYDNAIIPNKIYGVKSYVVEPVAAGSKILESAFVVIGGSSITGTLITADGETHYEYNGSANKLTSPLVGEYFQITTNNTLTVLKDCTIREISHWPNTNSLLTKSAGDTISLTANSYQFSVIGE